LVAPRLREGSEHPLPAARGLRAQGRGRPRLSRVSSGGRDERAGLVRDRWRGSHPLGLSLPRRRESRRERHPPRPGRARGRRPVMNATQWDAVLTEPVTEDRDHIQGAATAPVTLVEYGDYECPYCGAAYPIVKEIQARMGDRLRFVF